MCVEQYLYGVIMIKGIFSMAWLLIKMCSNNMGAQINVVDQLHCSIAVYPYMNVYIYLYAVMTRV